MILELYQQTNVFLSVNDGSRLHAIFLFKSKRQLVVRIASNKSVPPKICKFILSHVRTTYGAINIHYPHVTNHNKKLFKRFTFLLRPGVDRCLALLREALKRNKMWSNGIVAELEVNYSNTYGRGTCQETSSVDKYGAKFFKRQH